MVNYGSQVLKLFTTIHRPMKAAIIIGSAREDGNTEAQCRAVMDALEENGIEVDVIRPAKMDIHHCTGCNRCIDTDSCYMQDDMQVIYDAFDGSDVFILATPIYFSGPSSILKQVIDRFQCRWESVDEPYSDKYVALLCNGGSRNPRFENVISIVRAFAFGTRCVWAGETLVEGTDNDESKCFKDSYKFGVHLAEMLKDLE